MSARVATVVAGFALAFMSGPIRADDWPQLQNGPERKGFTPETIEGPFKIRWTWNKDQATAVRISYFVQPIVAAGRVFLGACDGKMHAIDVQTGREVWAFPTDGPILGTAAYGPDTGLVYFGSHDGRVYAVDAATGKAVWSFKTGEGVWAALLYVGGCVYVGSRDGYFYALNGRNGDLQWRFPAAGQEPLSPIYSPASYSPQRGLIYFGARDMRIYAVRADTGVLAAKSDTLNGINFGWYWPVVVESKGWIMVRTCNYAFPFRGPYQGTDAEIREWIDKNPKSRFFHTLDAATLSPSFTAPVLYQGGSYGRPCPPILDAAGRCYVVKNLKGYMSACRLAQMDLSTGALSLLSDNVFANYRIVGDEGSALSMAGNMIVVSNPQSLGLEDVRVPKAIPVVRESKRNRDTSSNAAPLYLFEMEDVPLMSSEVVEPGNVWHCSPDWTPASISGKTIFWISDGRALAAIEGR